MENDTIVDNNPISFVIAHKFFGLPDDLTCMVSDFRKFIYQDVALYDGIAIDLGGPDIQFNDEFNVETCDAIRAHTCAGSEPCDKGSLGLLSHAMGRNEVKPEQASKVLMRMPTLRSRKGLT